MAITYTSTVFENTYKDDYRDSDNYYRVLFNSGKALQARELTQLQTIIQSEIGRFARNIFHEGAMVSPGGITVNNKLEYLKLDTTTNALGTTAAGAIYQGNDNIRVEVLRVEPADATTGDPATLYVKYIKTDEALSFANAVRIADGENLTKISGTGPNTLTLAASSATGTATIAHVAAGDYFTKNHFVFADNQTILVSKYSNSPTTDLGFLITEDIVTVEDNVNLYDNQGAVPNTASPGADRYRIRLTLTTRDKLESEANFVYIARIVNGGVSLEATGFSDYNRFNDLLAQRTKEESGDYLIDPFITKFENLNDSNLTLNINPGVAYVDGYRLETPYTQINVPKTRTYEVNEKSVVAQYGNYVLQNTTSSNAGVPNIDTFAQVNLYDTSGGIGTVLGTAHVRGAERYASDIRWYLFDIRMNEGQSFSLVRSFGSDSNDYVDLRLTDGIALLNETANNSLLFPLPYIRARTALPDSLVVQKRYIFTSDGSGSSGAIPPGVYPSGTSLTFTDPGDWIVTKLDGSISDGDTGTISVAAGGTSFTITDLASSTQYEVLAMVSIATPQVKTKTRIATAITMAWPGDADSDGSGLKWLTLPHTDIYEFTRTRLTDSDGIDLSANFTFDNGQRDNFYTKGRLIQKPNLTIPTGNVYAKYTYHAHGDGHFFSVNSYAAYDYETIPKHRKNNGEIISLADVLDFRPNQIGVSGSDNYKDSSTSIALLPQNNNVIDMDNSTTYWLPRKDKLVIKRLEATSNKAELNYITGTPSLTPVEPSKPDGSMHLYSFNLNPYIINDSDFTSRMIENRGYTMKEIGELERRIDRLEEYTTLNLLEANTALQLVLDSSGNPRTKSGFLADPFKDLSFAEMNNEYRAGIDQEFNNLVPAFGQKNVRLIFDSTDAGNSNVTITGDLLTLSYTSVNHITQDLATETENVNPYDVVIIGGHTVLSPSSDDWVETRYLADNIINGGTANIVGDVNTLRNALANGWLGGGTVVGSNVVRRQIGDRVVSISVIPWMRSKKVAFMSTGLRPNTRYFAYFNEVAVDNWVRETNTAPFVRYATTTESFGNLYSNATQHPDGASILVSDETGTLKGSFFIPATDTIRFRTGTCVFKLLDVSDNNEAGMTSWSTTTFTSAGTLVTRQRDILSTRVNIIAPPPPAVFNDGAVGGGVDPLAQTFFIDGVENPNGIFATSVDLYFKTKDTVEPVRVQIAEVQNGTPTMNYLPGADAYVYPADVNIPANTNDLTSVRSASTRFTFEEPVYLSPNSEYAIIIKANTTAYNVYVAKTYEFLLGTTAARVNKQPSLGSLFTSQNASTWTPDQTRDLMFKLNRAEFSLDGTAVLRNGPIENYRLDNNPLRFASGDSDMWVYYPGHGFSTNDLVEISGLTDSIAGISSANINGTRLIREVDWSGFKVGVGSQATTSLIGGGSEVQIEQQAYFDEVFPSIMTITPQQTAIGAGVKFTSGGSYAGTLRNRSTGTNINAKSSTYGPIVLNQPNALSSPNVILSSRNETRWLAGDNSADIQITMVTLDNKVSPVIDLQRVSLMLTENRIDWQDSAASAGRNVPMFFTDETQPTGGSSASKHLTKQITLAEPAVGLKILLSANRPTEADFLIYYKTGTGDDVLDDKVWTLLDKESELPGDNDGTTYREYEYLAGGIGGELAPFTKYQVKIVPVSQNSSRIPRIRDLRIIALAT